MERVLPSRMEGVSLPGVEVLQNPIFDWEKVNVGVRKWDWAMGISPTQNPELFIQRAIIGCCMQFNFWQDRTEGSTLSAELVWKWIRGEAPLEDVFQNLVTVREAILNQTMEYVAWWKPLVHAIRRMDFWAGLNGVYNLAGGEDPVFKKVILAKMMLEDSGFFVAGGSEWGHACVDYNVLISLNHLGILQVPGGSWAKSKLDRVRIAAYWVCEHLLREAKDVTASALDAVMFFAGRRLRKEFGGELIPQVEGETNY
jgi:hypothetical protein